MSKEVYEKREGYESYYKGKSSSANPYENPGVDEWRHHSWQEGWDEAKDDDDDDL